MIITFKDGILNVEDDDLYQYGLRYEASSGESFFAKYIHVTNLHSIINRAVFMNEGITVDKITKYGSCKIKANGFISFVYYFNIPDPDLSKIQYTVLKLARILKTPLGSNLVNYIKMRNTEPQYLGHMKIFAKDGKINAVYDLLEQLYRGEQIRRLSLPFAARQGRLGEILTTYFNNPKTILF